MKEIIFDTTSSKQILDITDDVATAIHDLVAVKNGFCLLFVTHTTACLTTADLDPGTDEDMLDAFSAFIPQLHYRHPHNPGHVGDHILSSIIGPSLFIPVKNGQLLLGTWQRIVLVELDGPRKRKIILSFFSE